MNSVFLAGGPQHPAAQTREENMHAMEALDLSKYPRFVDRKTGAQIITENFFPVSPRSLERWPVPVRHLNGKAVANTRDLVAEAQRRFDAAPVLAAKKIGGAA